MIKDKSKIFFFILLVLIVSITILSFSMSNAVVISDSSITISSNKLNYSTKESGAWNLTSSVNWTDKNSLTLNVNLKTIPKIDYDYIDTFLVIDNSESMKYENWINVKAACDSLIDEVYSTSKNRMGLISFNSKASIEQVLTSDKAVMKSALDNLTFQLGTNYYQAFKKIEELLSTYTKESNREVLFLFITDGVPNEETPNERAQYKLVKQKYPYANIHVVQYEMGTGMNEAVSKIGDRHFAAEKATIKDKLIEASKVAMTYDIYNIIGNINTDDFDIIDYSSDKSIFNISSNTLTWNLDKNIKSGEEINAQVNLKLKSTYNGENINTNLLNDIIVNYKLDGISEKISSNLTLTVSNYNTVTYDANLPSGCSITNLPETKSYNVFDNVEISSSDLKCDGYQFKGYKIKTKGVKMSDSSHFVMPGKNVTIVANWSKLTFLKSMIGKVSKVQTLYSIMADNSVADNIVSKKVTSSSGINYRAISSSTNGEGIYLFSSTKNDTYPVYYYRGNVNNNNVKFAGFCWKIVRTTETGGVKLIYNGTPDSNGYCTNTTGTASQIGTSPYESKYLGGITFSYMHGDLYISALKYLDLFAVLDLTLKEKSNVQNTNYYYSDTVTYENGVYTLVNPTKSIYKENYNKLVLKYTCFSETETSCATVKQITSRNNYTSSFKYYEYKNGETYEQLYESNKSKKWIFGNDVTYTNGTYTLQNTTSTYIPDWVSSGRVATDKKYYTCFSEDKTCSTVYYLIRRNNSTTKVYYVSLTNGKKLNDIKEDSFKNVIDSEIKIYVDNWYKGNMMDYTKYLEDTNWCNEREFSDGALSSKDTSTTWSGFAPHSIAYARLNDASTKPKLTCDYERDRLNTNISGFNYPVALLTLDEYNLAGGYIKSNTNYYLYTNQKVYTLTPRTYYAFATSNYYVNNDGNLNGDGTNYDNKESYGVRPAISLKKGIRTDGGNGTPEDPYVVNEIVNASLIK